MQSSALPAHLLRNEAKRMARMPAFCIPGEFLAETNAPSTFSDFMSRAGRHDLEFLCQADLDAGAHASITADRHRPLADMATADRVRAAMDLDFLSGRPFRRSLLVKRGGGRTIGKAQPEHLADLHMAAQIVVDGARTTETGAAFKDKRGRPIATPVAGIGRAFTRLAQAFPATLPVAGLIGSGEDRARVAKALLQLLKQGQAMVSARPIAVGRATDERPTAWAYQNHRRHHRRWMRMPAQQSCWRLGRRTRGWQSTRPQWNASVAHPRWQ